jgi:hypothetical protein
VDDIRIGVDASVGKTAYVKKLVTTVCILSFLPLHEDIINHMGI